MNNHMSQILNDDLDVFFLSDFHHQSLILISTVNADHIFTQAVHRVGLGQDFSDLTRLSEQDF